MSSTPWLENAFREARADFLSSVPQRYHSEFSKFGKLGDVYQEISDIQKKQMKTKSLVALKRIEPYILGLKDYAAVIEVFTQVYPEILCLIWVCAIFKRSSAHYFLTIPYSFRGPSS
jgi:hypothetical protein